MDENNQELRESMDRLAELMGNNNLLLENQARILMAGMKQEDIDKLKLEQVFGRNSAAVDGNTDAVDKSSRAFKANQEAAEEYKKAMDNYVASLRTGADGLKKVFNNIISQDPSRSMAKYSDGLSTLGDAVSKAAENFGPLGKAVSASVGVFTKLVGVQLQQVDLLLKANDQLAQFGTAGSFTTKELMDMAHGAGVTSKNMDTLINPIKSLGPALTSLGGTASDGVKAFTSMAKITNEQREGFQRLGVSQEQLIQNQADYVKLQMMSGKSMTNEMKDRAALQRASLEYTENLLVLSNISGQDAESAKKKQQDAARAVEAQVAQIQLENRARRLDAEGRKDEAALIRKEAEGRKKAIDMLAVTGDEGAMKGVREFLSTGTLVSEEAQALSRLGLNDELKKLKAEIAAGGDAQKATAKFQDAYNKALINNVDKVGFAASRSADVAKAYNITESSLENASKQRDRNLSNELDTSRKKIEEAKKPGKDPAQDARAKMTTVEIEAGKAIDKLVGSINPLLNGFNALTIGGNLAAVALGAVAISAGSQFTKGIAAKGAAAVQSALGMGAKMAAPVATTVAAGAAPAAAAVAAPVAATAAGAGAAGAGTAATAATTAASALSKLAGPLAGLSKAAPLIGTVMSVGTGVVDAYQGIKKADKDLKEGTITKEEARVEKGEAVGGGAGTAIGGTAGALKGAAAGAAIGSVVPVLGTAVGGIIGAALGGWLGSKAGKAIGEVAGGGIAKMTSDADKKVDEASKKADAKKDTKTENILEKESAKNKNDPVKVSIVKVEDPNLMKSLGGMMPGTKLTTPELSNINVAKPDVAKAFSLTNSALKNVTAPPIKTVQDLAMDEAKKFGRTKPNIDDKESAQAQYEDQQAKLKSAPKAAVGGIFDGPKSGYPVELHGKEMITPLGTGTKTASLDTSNSAARDEELEKEIEAIKQLKDSLKESDMMFTKLSGSIMKLNKIEEDKIEKHEEEADALSDAQDKLKNVFKGAEFDLSKFSGRVKVLTDTAMGTGSAAPAGGAAGGTGVTPPSSAPPSSDMGGGAGVKPPSAPPMASMGGGTGVAPPVKQDIKQNLGDVKAALMKRGMGDEKYLNAVLGNVMKESGGKVINENLNYGKTSNDRIRSIFGSRAKGKTDEELNAIKSSPESMGEFMYGKDTKIGQSMGNLEPGDGFKYRGRGYIQLTGKSNYAAASQAIFGDDTLVKNPDLVNDPKIAADVVAWYMEKGKSRMAKAMGIDDKNMTQEQANLLATSQIAGGDVRKKGAYLSGEVMNKVTAYAGSKDIQGIEPSQGQGTMVASADTKKSDIPKAQRGGVFEGPDTGYLVELHGPETVIPNDKIASIAKKELESVSKMSGSIAKSDEGDFPKEVQEFFQLQGQLNSLKSLKADDGRETFSAVDPESQRAQERMFAKLDEMMSSLVSTGYDKSFLERGGDDEPTAPREIGASLAKYADEDSGVTDAMKKLMPAGMISDSQSSITTAPPSELVTTASETLKDITDNTKASMVDALKSMQDEFKTTLSQIMQRQPESSESMAGKDTVTELLTSKLDLMIDKLSQSNDTQDKLLQYSQV